MPPVGMRLEVTGSATSHGKLTRSCHLVGDAVQCGGSLLTCGTCRGYDRMVIPSVPRKGGHVAAGCDEPL